MAYLHHITLYTKVLLFSCISISISAQSSIDSISTDKVALLSLKSQFNIISPNSLSTWHPSASPCNWTGVSCSKDGGRVDGLDLSGLGLTGTISPSIGDLSFLRSLNLQNNQITGTIGPYIGNLRFLSSLYLQNNLLIGTVPAEIGNLVNLRYLNVSLNAIKGMISPTIRKCKELISLDLMKNAIRGQIPGEIGLLAKLQVLNLRQNHISGILPDSLGNLHKLVKIDLSENELFGRIPITFKNLQKLHSMDLSENMLNGSIPRETGFLGSVETINLSDNQLSGNIPEEIGGCENLKRFILANNKFSGKIPDALGGVSALETLDLSSNELSGEIPKSLVELHSLKHLKLSFNNLEGIVPAFTSSQKLELEGNPKLCVRWACKRNNQSLLRKWLVVGISTFVIAFIIVTGIFLKRYVQARKKGDPKSDVKSIGHKHPMITYDELRLATNNFSQDNVIGKGGFGTVYLGILAKGTAVAIKVLDPGMTGSFKSFVAECIAAKNVRHRNIVKLITVCSSLDFRNKEFLCLVYKFMRNGSLEDWLTGTRITKGKVLNLLDRLDVLIDVASALVYLHDECETPVVHCDIKPGNVLFDRDMTAKLGDFGLVRFLIDKEASISSTHALKGSIGYIPPEYGLGQKPSTAGDVYSFGIMLLEVFTGRSPTNQRVVGIGLKNWVQKAFPANIDQILDRTLLFLALDYDYDDCMRLHNTDTLHDCLISIISIGLSCVADSPAQRVSMKDALTSLNNVKSAIKKHMVK